MNTKTPCTSSRQSTVKGNKGKTCRAPYYGGVLKRKKENDKLRILFQNINGLGTSKENDKRDT